jgi:hypothetical protein
MVPALAADTVAPLAASLAALLRAAGAGAAAEAVADKKAVAAARLELERAAPKHHIYI